MSEGNDDKKRPSHVVYHVREGRKKDEAYWDRCGVAFEHGDKEGFNVELSSVPIDGRLTLRTPRERESNARDERPRSGTRERGRDRER